jgi:ParB/RepB/Spo0J family partition protein
MSNFDTSIVEIPVDDIKVGTTLKNIRTQFSNDALMELAESIHREGLMNPLTIMQSEDAAGTSVIELVAGERRLRAIKYIHEKIDSSYMPDIPCITYVGTARDAEFANALENIDREAVDDIDLASWLHRRVGEGETQTELADRLHRKLQWVNFRVTFHERACDELKQLLRDGLICFSAAYELSKNLDKDEQKKRVAKALKFNEKISLEDAQRANDPNKTAKPSKKSKEAIRALAETKAATSPFHRGVSFSLRWTEGLMTEEEMRDAMEMAENAKE